MASNGSDDKRINVTCETNESLGEFIMFLTNNIKKNQYIVITSENKTDD